MKIKKGTVAIYVLALMLVTAGYWNYISQESKSIETVSQINQEEQSTDTTDTSEENLGDATLVSNNEPIKEENKKVDEYFDEAQIARDNIYSQSLETYKGMLNNANVSEEQKTIVTQEITKLNQEKNAIMICEKLLETKGFEECVIFVNVESISVIVKTENSLKNDEIAQIQNIISREMNAKVENIHIMTR